MVSFSWTARESRPMALALAFSYSGFRGGLSVPNRHCATLLYYPTIIHYRTKLIHYYSTILPYYNTLHFQTPTLLHSCTTTLVQYYATTLLHYCTAILLHYYFTRSAASKRASPSRVGRGKRRAHRSSPEGVECMGGRLYQGVRVVGGIALGRGRRGVP